MVQVNRLTNANVYNNGSSLLGKVEEITLPGLKANQVDHKALGMFMGIKLPSGFESMTGKAKWNSVYPDLISEFGNPYNSKQIQVRGSLETWDSSGRIVETPCVAFMTIRFTDVLPPIGLKQNDNPEMESEFTCTYFRLEVDGAALIEVDAFAQLFFIADEDQLVAYRRNLGL